MNTKKMKQRRNIPQHISLALVLATTALQVSAAESVDFSSTISIVKENPCGLKVTSQGTSTNVTYKINAKGEKTLVLDGASGAKISAEASGGEDCRIGTIKLKLNNGNLINDSSALSSTSSNVYFPFDYVLGDTQVTNARGEYEDESQVYDKISVDRFKGAKNIHPKNKGVVNTPSIIPDDKTYHQHDGHIGWKTNGKIYYGSDNIPFWLTTNLESVIFNGSASKKVTFSLVPIVSVFPYDKTTGKKSTEALNNDDAFSATSVFTVTTI